MAWLTFWIVGQFERNRAWKRANQSHPEGLRWDFAWRSWGSRSVVGSGVLVVCGSGASWCRANWCCPGGDCWLLIVVGVESIAVDVV